MFTSTMSDSEIQQEARKDFFELSTKVRIAAQRFSRIHCDLVNNSQLKFNDTPTSLISKSVENRKWITRRRNTWTSHFRCHNDKMGLCIEMDFYLYTAVHRTKGTEYIFLNSLDTPVAERFTMHFIERYKERHLKPRGIDTGAMPAPLYFQIHNQHCILGRYYKTSDLDIAESKNKRFWIAPEGIYVTDHIDGMLTYITFMDKDDLSPLKKQVYEEEIVWDLMLQLIDDKLSDEERTKAAFSIYHNPDIGAIVERFAKRNVTDDADGGKQKLLLYIRQRMAETEIAMQDAVKIAKQQEKNNLRKSKITGTLDARNIIEEVDIKEYDIAKIKGIGKP